MKASMPRYRKVSGVEPGSAGNRPLLSTAQGGKIATDRVLLSLWEYAQERTLPEILANFEAEGATTEMIRAGLACLSEAGLLQRGEPETRPLFSLKGPLVSVVIVAYNSRDWLAECLPSLQLQTYSPLEIVVVDNASTDGVAEWLGSNYPDVRLVRLEKLETFARATNCGAAAAQGECLLLLNPDVRLEPDAVAHIVRIAREEPDRAIVVAKLKFWWAPSFINGIGNRVGAFSWGTDNALGHLDLGQFEHWVELPSACYAAVLISKEVWKRVGPADEKFPMYYEDTEWSYRARLLGYRVRAAPKAVVYHAFGGKVPSGAQDTLSPRKLRNVVYGRMRFAIKLVDRYLLRFLRNYWLEDWANFTRALSKRDWPSTKAYLAGWKDVIRSLPALLKERRALRDRRTLSDEDLFGLQRDMPVTLSWHGLPELTWDLIQHQYLPLFRSGRTRSMPEFDHGNRSPHLLIVSNDVVDVKMAGPGVRYLEMARSLSESLEVTLAVPAETSLKVNGLRIVRYWEERPGSLQVLVENSDIALISGYMVEKFPFLQNTSTRLVVDYYDPMALENLHYYLHEPMENQEALNQHAVNISNKLAEIGDFFICGNERQRDYWMGVLTANGRINPRNFANDASLRSLIDVVGIGFPDREPQGKPFLRSQDPRIPDEARIVLWGGGVWNWLDPLTLIKAWPQVLATHPEARLVFLGTRHPNPLVPPHEMAETALHLAEEIGEMDKSILFFEWLSYEDRESLLCEADVGVTLHPIHVETRYSQRTRVLDYLWARLPVLITDGDVTSEWVRAYDLGEVVPPFEVDAVASALIRILDQTKESWAPAFQPLREEMTWSSAVQPLLHYCREGGYAPDRLQRNQSVPASAPFPGALARARHIWRTEGKRVFLHRLWRYIQWRLARI